MLRVCVLVCAVLAVHAGFKNDCCSHDDREEILHTWSAVWSAEYSLRRVVVAREVFKGFLLKMPEAANILKGVNVDDMESDEFSAHCVRVMTAMYMLVNSAYDIDILHSQLNHLGEQHAKIDGLKPEYFDAFMETVMEVFPQAIPCFNAEVFDRCLNRDIEHIVEYLEDP